MRYINILITLRLEVVMRIIMTEFTKSSIEGRAIGKVNVGENIPRKWPKWLSQFAAWLLTKRGWKVEGELINQNKAILAVAPHTSNWDFFLGLCRNSLRRGVAGKLALLSPRGQL